MFGDESDIRAEMVGQESRDLISQVSCVVEAELGWCPSLADMEIGARRVCDQKEVKAHLSSSNLPCLHCTAVAWRSRSPFLPCLKVVLIAYSESRSRLLLWVEVHGSHDLALWRWRGRIFIDVSAPEGGVVGGEEGGLMAFTVALDADKHHDFEGGAIAMFAEVPIGLGDVVAGAIVGLCESHYPRQGLNQIVWLIEVKKALSWPLSVWGGHLVRG